MEMLVRTAIVGAGPTGLFIAISLARRGREVVLIDRDPGPPNQGEWRRRGVMQFQHAHSFRGQVVDAMAAEMPDVLSTLTTEAGATVVTMPENSGRAAALRCRRSIFERELRRCVNGQANVRFVHGTVDEVVERSHRAAGVRIAGDVLDADVVIDASGRASRLARTLRGSGERSDCAATYASRQYLLRDGAPVGPTNSVIGLSLAFRDYAAVVFLHDSRTFTVTLIHSGSDARLSRLRHHGVFEAAINLIPGLAEWISPERSLPTTGVLLGGRLYNSYRGLLDDRGQPILTGLISVGDAVCTTTPLAGRGIALAFMQAGELIRLLDHDDSDIACLTTEFDRWCLENVKPWFTDHRYVDSERVRRWAGHDVELDRPLPSDLVVAAADADPQLRHIVDPYVTMDALPASLGPAQCRAREIYARGWRPAAAPGPTLDELTSVVSRTPVAA